MSGGSKNHQERSDISLTLIYKACSSPNSANDLACRKALHAATPKQIDYTLRKLKSYTQQSQWSARRLIRCLDYLFTHGIKSSANLEDIIKMTSVMVCLKWVLSAALLLDDCLQTCTKFICNLLETIASKLQDSEATTRVLLTIKDKDVLRKLLLFTHHSDISIRTYSVRALTAKVQYFAKELIALNAYDQLNISLLSIPSLLETLYGKQTSKNRVELEQIIVTCHLLESLLKYEDRQQLDIRILFAESDAFSQLVHVWNLVCFKENNVIVNNAKRAKVKNGQLLVYYLTAIVQKCTSVSQKAASRVATDSPWECYLSTLMHRWIRGTCCTMNAEIITPATLRAERSVMEKLLRISLDIVPVLQHHQFWLAQVDQTICNLTNFFMAYISQPITPEQASMVGRDSTLLHTNICIDVEERGYMLTADMLQDHQDLLVLLLESFIQYVQLASSVNTTLISGRIGWCLKSFLTILLRADQLENSRLRSRLLKLVVFFLHYQDAIDVLATSTTSITPYVWGSTIELAKNGLITAMSLSPVVELTPQENSIIYKAKRAFVSLELISRHPRACERLMDCDVLQLVDISFIPSGKIIEKTSSLFGMYALFGRFIASLSRRTAYVRTRLRDECGLFPLIMRLLEQAIEHKEATSEATNEAGEQQNVRSGWNQVILGCLLVVNSFQYDESSTGLWLSWKFSATKSEKDVKIEQNMVIDDVEVIPVKEEREDYCLTTFTEMQRQSKPNSKEEYKSILPYVLSVLFPWRSHNMDLSASLKKGDDRHIINLAAQVLDQLSSVPLCGRQMIRDETALSNLSSLMVALTTAEVCKDDTDSMTDQCTFVPAQRKVEGSEQDVVMEESILDNLEPRISEHDPSDGPEVSEDALNMQCAQHLQRSATRILICHDNIQFTILSDAFTNFFRPTIRHPSHNTSHEHWRREICDNLYKLKLGDFEKLYKFTEVSGDHAIKLYEFTAIAVGYSAIGATTVEDWNSALGLTALEENIVSTRCVFGVFCQMLVFELEYDEDAGDVKEEELEQQDGKADSILTLITPLRRHAAAQVIEALALEHEIFWKVQTDSIRDMPFIPNCIHLDTPAEIVHFKTDDSSSLISGNRQLLRARSPIFEAMLGSHYAEENDLAVSKAIPLHDVSFHSLNLFITVIHQLNDEEADDLDSTIISWPDIIDLLLISDRFGSKVVKHRCEHWVLDRVRHLNTVDKEERSVYLEGLLRLYRYCRDPIDRGGGIESETWPFAIVVKESLKSIVQFLSEACQTAEFMKMVKDKNIEELDAFCDGIAYLIKRN